MFGSLPSTAALADILSFTFFFIVGTSHPLDDGRQCGGPYARGAFGSPFVCPRGQSLTEHVSAYAALSQESLPQKLCLALHFFKMDLGLFQMKKVKCSILPRKKKRGKQAQVYKQERGGGGFSQRFILEPCLLITSR